MNSKTVACVRVILTCILCIATEMNLNRVSGEWIELPQFSNAFKVYRLTDLNNELTIINSKATKNLSINILPEKFDKTHKIVLTHYPDEEGYDFLSRKKKISDDISNVNSQDILISTIPPIIVTKTNILHPVYSTSIANVDSERHKATNSSKSEISFNAKNDTKGQSSQNTLLKNFPFKLFNIVHGILLSNHARTFEAKKHYLNNLREKLLEDIDVIFKNMKKVNREKRSYYSEEQDQHIGFPSLEGALLAISFLTFSVYLIQLVMMLLRNISSNPTSTGTVLVNRNKRYINELHNSTKICEYIYEFTCR